MGIQSNKVKKMSEFKFALNLLKTTTGNACVSPLNIAHSLGMVMLGADGETRDEVARGVGFGAAEDAHKALSASIKALTTNNIASVAARLFVQRGFQLKDQFQADAAKSAETINKWVTEKTANMITELFSAGDIDPNMLVALCSALHFKGVWKEPFEAPFKDEFNLDGDTKVTTNYILRNSRCPISYSAELNCQVVELAYTNGTQMILV